MLRIDQSIAKKCVFKAYLSGTATPATGKTIAITISKNGGAFGNPAAGATNATEISSGWYFVDLGTGDTGTLGPLAVRGAVATIDDVGVLYEVGLPLATQASVDTIDGIVDAILVDTGTDIPTLINDLNDPSLVDIATAFEESLISNTRNEPTGVPTFPATIVAMLSRLYASQISPVAVVSNKITFSNLASVAQWAKALSDDGTTYAEAVAGAP